MGVEIKESQKELWRTYRLEVEPAIKADILVKISQTAMKGIELFGSDLAILSDDYFRQIDLSPKGKANSNSMTYRKRLNHNERT